MFTFYEFDSLVFIIINIFYLEKNMPTLKKSAKEEDTETTKFKMSNMDIIWCFLGLAVAGFTFFIFTKVNEVHIIQRNVKRYDYKNFKDHNGEALENYE